MENDQVFEAEAEIESGSRSLVAGRDASNTKSTKLGEVTATLANAAPGGQRLQNIVDETEPLLGRRDSADAGSDDGEPDWPGKRDFEGAPWWKRPSVRIPFLGHTQDTVGLTNCADILAAPSLCPHRARLWWNHRPEA